MIKSKLYQWALAFFILILISGCSGIYENGKELAADTKSYVEEITPDELDSKIENAEDFFLIDVRQAEEFDMGNIPYSTSIPRGVLEFKIGNETFLLMQKNESSYNFDFTVNKSRKIEKVKMEDLRDLQNRDFPFHLDKKLVNSIFHPQMLNEISF